jgi:hypothetical protein
VSEPSQGPLAFKKVQCSMPCASDSICLGIKGRPLLQAAALARGMANNRMSCLVDDGGGTLTVPIFHVSSVSGTGLALLHAFLRALPTGMPRTIVLQADLATPALLLACLLCLSLQDAFMWCC